MSADRTTEGGPMHPFHGIDGIERPEKPREYGITMVADWGIGPNLQADLLQTGADFFDFAKIAVGLSRVLSSGLLRGKLVLYHAHDIAAFPDLVLKVGIDYLTRSGFDELDQSAQLAAHLFEHG